jgi:hypothetical protein
MTGSTQASEATTDAKPVPAARHRLMQWVRKGGIALFLFYLIKGLLWLIVPFLIGRSLL